MQIASLQSLRSESREYPDAQLVIIDEAHCAVSESCLQLCRHYKVRFRGVSDCCANMSFHLTAALLFPRQGNHAFIVGLTATPMRLDPTETLSTVFDKLIKGPSITELVAQNVVVPPLVHFVSAVSQFFSHRGLRGSVPFRSLTAFQCMFHRVGGCAIIIEVQANQERS